MTAKASRYIVRGIQITVISVVVALGVAVYRLDATLRNVQEEEAGSAETASAGRARANGVEFAAVLDRFEDMMRRMEAIERKVGALNTTVAQRIATDSAGAWAPATNGPVAPESLSSLDNRPDLESRFAEEASTSRWGESAGAAIQDAFNRSYANKQFFVENPGDILTDCRESACSITWTPAKAEAAMMSAEERGEVLERARWEVVGLLEGVQEAGYFRVVINNDSEHPSLELLLEHEMESDGGIQDRVSTYLGLGEGGSKSGAR